MRSSLLHVAVGIVSNFAEHFLRLQPARQHGRERVVSQTIVPGVQARIAGGDGKVLIAPVVVISGEIMKIGWSFRVAERERDRTCQQTVSTAIRKRIERFID